MHVGDEVVNFCFGLEEDLAEAIALLRTDLDEEVSGVIEDLVKVKRLSGDLTEHFVGEDRLIIFNDGSSGGGGESYGEKSEFHWCVVDYFLKLIIKVSLLTEIRKTP